MDEFVQTMKNWHRMCKTYTTEDESCCYGCPVVDLAEHGCGAIFEVEDSTDWERYEGAIREWAAEHPEPVYPTWGEWLEKQGVVKTVFSPRYEEDGASYYAPMYEITNPIPAEIAEKLGIEPKEG